MEHRDPKFFAAVTLGERGQVVIPQEARDELGLEPGDKLLIFRHGPRGVALVLIRAQDVSRFVQDAIERLSHLGRAAAQPAGWQSFSASGDAKSPTPSPASTPAEPSPGGPDEPDGRGETSRPGGPGALKLPGEPKG